VTVTPSAESRIAVSVTTAKQTYVPSSDQPTSIPAETPIAPQTTELAPQPCSLHRRRRHGGS
jgi:hypothetical protein